MSGLSVQDSEFLEFVILLVVNERENSVVALHLYIGSLKTSSGLESVPRCKPSTYQPNGQ